jgi:hypothetical protein
MWVYSQGLPFTYPSWWIQLFCGWMEHLDVDAWLYFPGFKVGQIHIYLSFLTIERRLL